MNQTLRMSHFGAKGSKTVKLLRWLVLEGETFEKGALIAEVETAKAVVEWQLQAAGRVVSLLVEEGDTVEVGAPVLEFDPDAVEERVSSTPDPQPEPEPESEFMRAGDEGDDKWA